MQLTLFEPLYDHTQDQPIGDHSVKFVHWVGVNATERGAYYHYYWQSGVTRRVTNNRYIRGTRVGSALGESRKFQVERLIQQGKSPSEIGKFLESLPMSIRRCRYPSWEKVHAQDEDMLQGELLA